MILQNSSLCKLNSFKTTHEENMDILVLDMTNLISLAEVNSH